MSLHPVDVHVGFRLKSKRVILGISQEELGNAVGVTFQQIQKYERGLNRISSSRLYEFSCILGAEISYFFEDVDGPLSAGKDVKDSKHSESGSVLHEEEQFFEHEKFNNKEVLYLVRYYLEIKDLEIRKKIFSLIKSLSSYKVNGGSSPKGNSNKIANL